MNEPIDLKGFNEFAEKAEVLSKEIRGKLETEIVSFLVRGDSCSVNATGFSFAIYSEPTKLAALLLVLTDLLAGATASFEYNSKGSALAVEAFVIYELRRIIEKKRQKITAYEKGLSN